MKRIYIAGKYNDDSVVKVLKNMRAGMRMGVQVLASGFAPFVPWFDYQMGLMANDDEVITREMYHEFSMAWLEASSAVLALPSWVDSNGAKREIERAKALNIPVFYSLEELKEAYHVTENA